MVVIGATTRPPTGDSSTAATCRCVSQRHAAKDRDRVIADALSKLITDDVTPIKKGTRKRAPRSAG